jgi:hypothetical protein
MPHRKFLLYALHYRKYTERDLPCREQLAGNLSKHRSLFASQDVLIALSTFTSLQKLGAF